MRKRVLFFMIILCVYATAACADYALSMFPNGAAMISFYVHPQFRTALAVGTLMPNNDIVFVVIDDTGEPFSVRDGFFNITFKGRILLRWKAAEGLVWDMLVLCAGETTGTTEWRHIADFHFAGTPEFVPDPTRDRNVGDGSIIAVTIRTAFGSVMRR